MLDSRPARHPLYRREVKRHDVKAREQDTIEGARRGNEIGTACGGKHGSDNCVDRLLLDPHILAAALLLGGRRAPVEQLLVAGRK